MFHDETTGKKVYGAWGENISVSQIVSENSWTNKRDVDLAWPDICGSCFLAQLQNLRLPEQ